MWLENCAGLLMMDGCGSFREETGNGSGGFGRVLHDLAFPESDNSPSSECGRSGGLAISCLVSLEFGLPENGIWATEIPMTVARAAVPEATVDKHGDLFLDEGYVGRSPWSYAPVESVSSTERAERASQKYFGLSVASTTTA